MGPWVICPLLMPWLAFLAGKRHKAEPSTSAAQEPGPSSLHHVQEGPPTSTTSGPLGGHGVTLMGYEYAKALRHSKGGQPHKAWDMVEAAYCQVWGRGMGYAKVVYRKLGMVPPTSQASVALTTSAHLHILWFVKLLMVHMAPLYGSRLRAIDVANDLRQHELATLYANMFDKWGGGKCIKVGSRCIPKGMSLESSGKVNVRDAKGYVRAHLGSYTCATTHKKKQINLYIHRVGCWLVHGPPPHQGVANALHTCHVRNCINPAHLTWGTKAENAQMRPDRGGSTREVATP